MKMLMLMMSLSLVISCGADQGNEASSDLHYTEITGQVVEEFVEALNPASKGVITDIPVNKEMVSEIRIYNHQDGKEANVDRVVAHFSSNRTLVLDALQGYYTKGESKVEKFPEDYGTLEKLVVKASTQVRGGKLDMLNTDELDDRARLEIFVTHQY